MKKIYAVYDKVAEEIMDRLLVFSHDAAAVRFFQDALQDQQTILHKHPEDFELRCCGELESDGGVHRQSMDGKQNYPCVVLSGASWLATQQPGQLELLKAKEA